MSKMSDFNIERNFLRKRKKLSLFRSSNFQNKLSMVENQTHPHHPVVLKVSKGRKFYLSDESSVRKP